MEKISVLFTAAVAAFVFAACNGGQSKQQSDNEYLVTQGFAQGTTWHITYHSLHNEDLTHTFDSILNAFDFSISSYNQQSLLTKINNNEDVEVDSIIKTVFLSSLDMYNLTKGMFDPTCRPLVNAWGFAKHENFKKPTQHEIDSILKFVGMDKVKIENNRIVKADNRLTLNFNANAQGYSVDLVCDFLKANGYSDYLVEIGGETRAVGKNPHGDSWRVAIECPIKGSTEKNRQIQTVVPLTGGLSLCTSGDYRNFFTADDGVMYSHELNPITGYPNEDSLVSVSIIAPSGLVSDGLATAVMVIGMEDGFRLIDSLPDTEGYFIYGSEGTFKTKATKGFETQEL